jgi:hypothetical protein
MRLLGMCDNSHIARIITDSDEHAAWVALRAEMPDIFRFDKRGLWSETRAAAPVKRLHEAPVHRSELDSVPLLLAARQADFDWVGRVIETNFDVCSGERHLSNGAAAVGAQQTWRQQTWSDSAGPKDSGFR